MLVILDVMLPGMDGEDILRELRKVADVPTLMLMPPEGESDRVPGLSLGADDYLIQPRRSMDSIRAQWLGCCLAIYGPNGGSKR